jgi:hypothetical protein
MHVHRRSSKNRYTAFWRHNLARTVEDWLQVWLLYPTLSHRPNLAGWANYTAVPATGRGKIKWQPYRVFRWRCRPLLCPRSPPRSRGPAGWCGSLGCPRAFLLEGGRSGLCGLQSVPAGGTSGSTPGQSHRLQPIPRLCRAVHPGRSVLHCGEMARFTPARFYCVWQGWS